MVKGIHYNITPSQYHAWKLDKAKLAEGPISSSVLRKFAVNPYHWLRTEDSGPTEAMDLGTLYDAALTCPDELGELVVEKRFDNFRTKEAREWRDEQVEAGKIIVEPANLERVQRGVEAVTSHKVAGEILDGASFQAAVIGEAGNIPTKSLVDIVPDHLDWDDHLVDFKTTSKGLDDESIRKQIGELKYHWQAAFYRTGWNQVAGHERRKFSFVFLQVETHEVRVVTLSDDAMRVGMQSVRVAMTKFITAAYKGIRSAYENRADEIDLMPYHAMNEEDWVNAEE